jgi:DNA-binding Lrp family transcriptional regulator
MEKYHNTNVSPRTLSRRIKELHDQGYIIRVQRNWSEVNGSKKFRCNLYYLTKKLLLWVKKLGDYARKVFSHFRMPSLAHYSLKTRRRDLQRNYGDVEILFKSGIEGRASPV